MLQLNQKGDAAAEEPPVAERIQARGLYQAPGAPDGAQVTEGGKELSSNEAANSHYSRVSLIKKKSSNPVAVGTPTNPPDGLTPKSKTQEVTSKGVVHQFDGLASGDTSSRDLIDPRLLNEAQLREVHKLYQDSKIRTLQENAQNEGRAGQGKGLLKVEQAWHQSGSFDYQRPLNKFAEQSKDPIEERSAVLKGKLDPPGQAGVMDEVEISKASQSFNLGNRYSSQENESDYHKRNQRPLNADILYEPNYTSFQLAQQAPFAHKKRGTRPRTSTYASRAQTASSGTRYLPSSKGHPSSGKHGMREQRARAERLRAKNNQLQGQLRKDYQMQIGRIYQNQEILESLQQELNELNAGAGPDQISSAQDPYLQGHLQMIQAAYTQTTQTGQTLKRPTSHQTAYQRLKNTQKQTQLAIQERMQRNQLGFKDEQANGTQKESYNHQEESNIRPNRRYVRKARQLPVAEGGKPVPSIIINSVKNLPRNGARAVCTQSSELMKGLNATRSKPNFQASQGRPNSNLHNNEKESRIVLPYQENLDALLEGRERRQLPMPGKGESRALSHMNFSTHSIDGYAGDQNAPQVTSPGRKDLKESQINVDTIEVLAPSQPWRHDAEATKGKDSETGTTKVKEPEQNVCKKFLMSHKVDINDFQKGPEQSQVLGNTASMGTSMNFKDYMEFLNANTGTAYFNPPGQSFLRPSNPNIKRQMHNSHKIFKQSDNFMFKQSANSSKNELTKDKQASNQHQSSMYPQMTLMGRKEDIKPAAAPTSGIFARKQSANCQYAVPQPAQQQYDEQQNRQIIEYMNQMGELDAVAAQNKPGWVTAQSAKSTPYLESAMYANKLRPRSGYNGSSTSGAHGPQLLGRRQSEMQKRFQMAALDPSATSDLLRKFAASGYTDSRAMIPHLKNRQIQSSYTKSSIANSRKAIAQGPKVSRQTALAAQKSIEDFNSSLQQVIDQMTNSPTKSLQSINKSRAGSSNERKNLPQSVPRNALKSIKEDGAISRRRSQGRSSSGRSLSQLSQKDKVRGEQIDIHIIKSSAAQQQKAILAKAQPAKEGKDEQQSPDQHPSTIHSSRRQSSSRRRNIDKTKLELMGFTEEKKSLNDDKGKVSVRVKKFEVGSIIEARQENQCGNDSVRNDHTFAVQSAKTLKDDQQMSSGHAASNEQMERLTNGSIKSKSSLINRSDKAASQPSNCDTAQVMAPNKQSPRRRGTKKKWQLLLQKMILKHQDVDFCGRLTDNPLLILSAIAEFKRNQIGNNKITINQSDMQVKAQSSQKVHEPQLVSSIDAGGKEVSSEGLVHCEAAGRDVNSNQAQQPSLYDQIYGNFAQTGTKYYDATAAKQFELTGGDLIAHHAQQRSFGHNDRRILDYKTGVLSSGDSQGPPPLGIFDDVGYTSVEDRSKKRPPNFSDCQTDGALKNIQDANQIIQAYSEFADKENLKDHQMKNSEQQIQSAQSQQKGVSAGKITPEMLQNENLNPSQNNIELINQLSDQDIISRFALKDSIIYNDASLKGLRHISPVYTRGESKQRLEKLASQIPKIYDNMNTQMLSEPQIIKQIRPSSSFQAMIEKKVDEKRVSIGDTKQQSKQGKNQGSFYKDLAQRISKDLGDGSINFKRQIRIVSACARDVYSDPANMDIDGKKKSQVLSIESNNQDLHVQEESRAFITDLAGQDPDGKQPSHSEAPVVRKNKVKLIQVRRSTSTNQKKESESDVRTQLISNRSNNTFKNGSAEKSAEADCTQEPIEEKESENEQQIVELNFRKMEGEQKEEVDFTIIIKDQQENIQEQKQFINTMNSILNSPSKKNLRYDVFQKNMHRASLKQLERPGSSMINKPLLNSKQLSIQDMLGSSTNIFGNPQQAYGKRPKTTENSQQYKALESKKSTKIRNRLNVLQQQSQKISDLIELNNTQNALFDAPIVLDDVQQFTNYKLQTKKGAATRYPRTNQIQGTITDKDEAGPNTIAAITPEAESDVLSPKRQSKLLRATKSATASRKPLQPGQKAHIVGRLQDSAAKEPSAPARDAPSRITPSNRLSYFMDQHLLNRLSQDNQPMKISRREQEEILAKLQDLREKVWTFDWPLQELDSSSPQRGKLLKEDTSAQAIKGIKDMDEEEREQELNNIRVQVLVEVERLIERMENNGPTE